MIRRGNTWFYGLILLFNDKKKIKYSFGYENPYFGCIILNMNVKCKKRPNAIPISSVLICY